MSYVSTHDIIAQVRTALTEDLGGSLTPANDITANLIPAAQQATSRLDPPT